MSEIVGDNIAFLFGAGASVEAGIPISSAMVNSIESLIEHEDDWKPFRDLYFYLRSSINYSDGIHGHFNESFNVERLLIVISEIEKRDKNIIYPFIGNWNQRLLDLAGVNFENITKLHRLIRKQLNDWVRLRNYERASYYSAFSQLQGDIGSLIRIFTLNYDLCFERIVGRDRIIEVGFNNFSKDWHYSNFENETNKHFLLFKLHGSIDWYIENNKLLISDDPVEKPELIFGIQHKLTSVDPYFYYSSRLRETCFSDNIRLVVSIGYSFADEYVNKILAQALAAKENLRLICVGPTSSDDNSEASKVLSMLELNEQHRNRILIVNDIASRFMTSVMNKDYFSNMLLEPSDAPF